MKLRGFNMTKDELNLVTHVFNNGETHAIYTDTDSVIIEGRDKTPCMYEYAGIILKVLENV